MTRTVYIIEDDHDMRDSLQLLMEGHGYSAVSYPSAEDFLAELECVSAPPRCILLDVGLPSMDGLEVQRELKQRDVSIPIVMLSGHADVPMAVEALQGGALDFLEKPVPPDVLFKSVERGMEVDLARAEKRHHETDYKIRTRSLSSREREVLDLLVAGRNSKQMAADMGIGVATVLKHRAHMLAKMGVKSDVELTLLAASVNAAPGPESAAQTARQQDRR